ncbi:DENN domain-containing protein 1C [Pelodytes ibericus]
MVFLCTPLLDPTLLLYPGNSRRAAIFGAQMENPEKIFDGFFEVLRPVSSDADPELKRQFPEHLDDQDSVATMTKFCFPFDVERWENASVQHFSFTLTDLQGYQRFGFCRLSILSRSCICILSCLPWFEFFYKLLNNIAEHLAKEQSDEVDDLLQSLYQHPVPQTNTALSLDMLSYFITPDPSRLPSVPENRNLTEFMVAVQVETMLQLYSSLLFERRILITCSKLSTLTACVHASAGLLYPMYWQHIYIPTLPPHLLDYICAPMPYLIGIHSSLMQKVSAKTLEDVVVFNVDTNNLETPFQDLQNLPPHVVTPMKVRLRKQTALMGDGVSRVFLGAQAMLFGGYRDALICTPGEPISFCHESFLNTKCSALRRFLQSAVHLQLFTQFIDSRLEKLNAGGGFTDIFEQEITRSGLSGNSRSYQLWLDNLKKGSGSLINNMKSRAHPAMRNMLRYAKGQARTGLQGMRSRMKQKDQLHRAGSLRADGGPTENHEKLQSRMPITQHFGKSRPKRPRKKNSEGDYLDSERPPEDETSRESDAVPEAADEFPLLEDQGMDLLEEIFETLNTRAPGEERALYGTHSLDFFNLDDSQYFTRSISPTSEEDLSISQPRDSYLWYLQEEDETSDQNNMSPEVASLASDNMENASQVINEIPPSTEVNPTTPKTSLSTQDVTSPTVASSTMSDRPTGEEEIPLAQEEVKSSTNTTTPAAEEVESLHIEVTPVKTEVESITNDDTPPFIEITPPTNEVRLLNKKLTLPTSEISAMSKDDPHEVLHPDTLKSESTMDPFPHRSRKSEDEGAGKTDLHQDVRQAVPGSSVKKTISRFQSGPLDPRLVWPGTKREAAQRVSEWINEQQQQQINTAPSSNISHSNPKLRARTGCNNPKPLQSYSAPKTASSTTILARDGITHGPQSADLGPPALPKVSELKKRFEG